MPKAIQITITTTADLKGIQAVQKALQGLGGVGGGKGANLAAPLTAAGTAAAKSEKQILSLASAQSRLQATQGNLTGAANTLSAAIGKVDQSSVGAIRAQTQLQQIQNKLSGQTQSLSALFGNLGSQLSGLGGSTGSAASAFGGLASSLGTVGAVGAALGLAKVGADLAVVGGQSEQTRTRFDQLAKQAGTTGDAMLAALRKASAGTISDTALQLAAMKASLLGVAQNAEQLGPILAIARDRAQQMGISVEFAFDSLVTGLGRGSRLILDNVGVIVKADQANAAYAATIGKSVSQLTDQEQKQALINEVIRQGNETIAATGGAVEGAATNQQRFAASIENTKNKLGELIANLSGGMVQGLSDVANASSGTATDLGSAAVALANFARSLSGLPALTKAQADAVRDGAQAVAEAKQDYNDLTAQQYGFANAASAHIMVSNQQAEADRKAAEAAQQSAPAIMQSADAADRRAAASQRDEAATIRVADADDRRAASAYTAGQATQTSADASLLDATNKERQAAQTELLQFQTKQAADAFLALNPNIDGSGIASAVAAGKISAAVGQYIAMTLAAARARAELANLQAQAGMSPALKAAAQAAGGGDVGRYITTPVDPRAKAEGEAAVKRLKELNAQEKAHADAVRNATMTNGTAAQKQALLNKEYQDAARIYGSTSTQAINAKTALDQLTAQQEKAGTKRANAAQAGADRLASIEQSTGNKLEDIDRSTQAKLIEIDRKAAEARAAAAQRLNEMIATTADDRRAQDEADDLELIGVKDKQQAQALNDRERAQAASREREAAAAKEAQDLVASGEAEAAGKVYEIRETQIGKQQELDEKYAERQRELSGNKDALDALQTQYDEGTRAIQEAADRRVGFELAAAAQARQAVEDEKAAVIAAAEDQKNHVIDRAQQSAEGVKKASGDARAKAVADLQAIGSAVTAIPTSKTITINVQQTGSTVTGGGAAGTQNRAAGGGMFMTHGPTTLRVGDNPGGIEAVSVTPLSGRGRTSVGGSMMRMAGGGTVVIDAGGGYTTPIAGSGKGGGKAGGGGGGGAAGPKPVDVTAATKQLNEQIAFLKATAELAYLLKSPIPSIDTKALQDLANESKRMGAVVGSQLVPISKDNMKLLDDYDKAIKGSIGILTSVQSARKDLAEPQPPIDVAYIKVLANETKAIGAAIGGLLVPISQTALMELEDYEKAVSSSVSVLRDVQDLRKDLAEPQPPLDPVMLTRMAFDAQKASGVIKSFLIPYSEEQADQMNRYADAVGSSVSVLKDVAELNDKLFSDYASPTDKQLKLFAFDANRIAQAFTAAADTYKKETLEATKLYNDAIGGAFSNVKEGLLAIEALNSGDFELKPGVLGAYEAAAAQMIDTVGRLASSAKTIPADSLTALGAVTSAISGQAEAFIKMAAVPWGDMPAATAGFAQQAGVSMGGVTIQVYQQPGQDMNTLANLVIQKLNTQTYARR